MTTNQELAAWVKTVAALTQPDRIHWCDGSPEEHGRLIDEMLASGTLIKLKRKGDKQKWYTCSKKEKKGPLTHWS